MVVQAQMIILLQQLHKQFGFAVLMISHDIRVLRHFCHKIAVMKDGNFCEINTTKSLLKSKEPYTQLLLKCEYVMEAY
jgi:peptide/nickel transport system ATP-binding protein